MVRPADLCHQWCHKFIILISLVELLHTVEAATVEAFDAGIWGAIYAQCNNGALLYELFCCIQSIKKTFDEQRVLPSFSCNVEAVLRNEEIYEADLWYKELSGDIE